MINRFFNPQSFKGGGFVLQIPAEVWLVVVKNKNMEGIDVTPTENPDGSFTVTLSPEQWATFQENQKPKRRSPPKEEAAPEKPKEPKQPKKHEPLPFVDGKSPAMQVYLGIMTKQDRTF